MNSTKSYYACNGLSAFSDREIKAKMSQDHNIFNAERTQAFGVPESAQVFSAHNGKPAQLVKPRPAGIVIGTDSTSFQTEASSNFTQHGGAKRELLKPKYVEISRGRVMQRNGTPTDSYSTTAMLDFKNPGTNTEARRKVWGNKSHDVFNCTGEGNFTTEAQNQFGSHTGRPASSKRPPRKELEPHTFDGRTSYNSAFHYNHGPQPAARERGHKPRAARSEITESHLIHHNGNSEVGYVTEARGNFAAKSTARQAPIIHQPQGIGFGFGKDDREFSSEGVAQYQHRKGSRAQLSKWGVPGKYQPSPDDRDFLSEAQSRHTHGGPHAAEMQRLLKEEQRRAAEEMQLKASQDASTQETSSPRSSRRASRQPSRQSSRGSARPSQPPSQMSQIAEQSYVPAFSPQANSSRPQSKRASKFKRNSRNHPSVGDGASSGIRSVAARSRQRDTRF
jgi:hypothetical protein